MRLKPVSQIHLRGWAFQRGTPVTDHVKPVNERSTATPGTASIPVSWRGPACTAFDKAMAKSSGVRGYDRAQALASMLATYDEMTFEPSKREQAILDARKGAIADAEEWVRENVLENPVIKSLMYETVRDLGRYDGDLEADEALRAYLAEMEGLESSAQPAR